jgi:hypothetical protein
MINYNQLLTYGDFIPLKISCNTDKLFEEIKDFQFAQYNPRKNIPRYGLSITSLDGSINGKDLDSLYELSKEENVKYDEDSFTTLTDVYYKSKEVQELVDPFKPWLCRTHFLSFNRGGYFPPHIDNYRFAEQRFMRLLVPLRTCNPPSLYFMLEDKPLIFNEGYTYFVNTNKRHAIFSFDSQLDNEPTIKHTTMLVMNIKCCEESIKAVFNNMLCK